MKNKKFLYPLFVLMFLITIYSALSFVPYDCNTTANIYDSFSDNSLNLSLWTNLTNSAGIVKEINNIIEINISSASDFAKLWTNISIPATRTSFGLLGAGGCIKLNLTANISNANHNFSIFLNNTLIYSLKNPSSLGYIYPLVVELWNSDGIVYYNYSLNGTGGTLLNMTSDYTNPNNLYLFLSPSGSAGISRINLNKIWINQTGIVIIKVYDELTGNLISVPLTISKSDNISTTSTSHINTTLLTNFDRISNFQFSGTNYDYRIYKNVGAGGIKYLNAYLLNTTLTNSIETTFTIKNLKGNLIENALMNITKILNGSVVTITSTTSDVAGIVHIYLDRTTPYTFYINKEGYNLKTFSLYPTSYTYTITLNENTSQMFNDTKGDITYEILPYSSTLTENSTQQFSLTTSSPSGYILNYGVYSGATKDNNTETTGGTATIIKDTSGLSNSTINVYYFIQSQGGYIQLNRSYFIYDAIYNENQTLSGIFSDLSTQINPFYRFLIALIISLVLGAGFFSLVGTNGATIIAWLSFMGFGVVGFIPWVFPLIIGILIVLGFVVVGGNEGT